tara:strand:- start:576 stop:1004 length:429 start_codon:yes stop_codon:yes gene_type:complete
MKMIKKSKVKSIQANGTWEGKFGLMYKNEVLFENGDCGEYSSKTKEQEKFVVGQETEYEFIDGNFPKVKPVYNNPVSGGFSGGYKKDDNVQKMIVKQSSLKAAVDYCGNNNCSVADILKVANQFSEWVLENKMPDAEDEMPF